MTVDNLQKMLCKERGSGKRIKHEGYNIENMGILYASV